MDKKILIIAIFVMCIAVVVLYITPLSVETREMHIIVTTEKHVGINLDTDKIYFGTVPVEGSAIRNVTIANSGSKKRFVLSVEGPLESWTVASQSRFILQSGENKTVSIHVTVPKNATPGEYTSDLVITAYRTI
ncbi:MAG: hypothetical protein QW063_02665 [Candidatus Nanoarchaeia archaeon]